MKIYSGTYGNDTLESNSLTANLLKFPEISSTLVRQYPQYSVAYMVDGLGRFAKKEKLIGDHKFQWPVLGRTNRPSTCTGTFSGTGAGHTAITFETEENYLNPNDIVRLKDKSQGVIIGLPTQTAGGYTYTMKLQDPTQVGNATVNTAVAFATGATVGKIGTLFAERSERGYESKVFPDWYVNYVGISRKADSLSGSALTDVTWIENNGSKLWYFTQERICRDEFMREREYNDWYGISTMDENGNPTIFDEDGRPLIGGDGILRQIDSANIDTYNGVLTAKRLTNFMAMLGLSTGKKGTHWFVYTGTAGKVAFHEAMVDYAVPGGNLVYNAQTGKEMALGADFVTYFALGYKMTVVHTPMFDDPNIHTDIDAASGYPKESFRMVFINADVVDGESNIERLVKGAEGFNRSFTVKYIPGMINPFEKGAVQSMIASNSRDAFSVEYLTECGLIIRNTLSCGMLVFA